MPAYVYGCDKDYTHPRKEVNHGMHDEPTITCDKCGSLMHKVPQAATFYMNPQNTLTSWMDENHRRTKAGEPREEYNVKRPGPGIPQKDFNTRQYKEFI